MKLVFTLLFFGVVLTSSGQDLEVLEKKLDLLQNRAHFKYDTTGISTLPQFNHLCFEGFDSYEFVDASFLDYFHVVDLNKDGLKDLIYSGPCLPYDHTAIFLNEGLSYKPVFNYPGSMVSLEQSSGKTTVLILKKACCCDHYSEYLEVVIQTDSKVYKNQITFAWNTEVKVDKLKRIKVVGVLRSTPEMDDAERKDDCTDRIIVGNHLAYLEKPIQVVQLSRIRGWSLIQYAETQEQSWIGWIRTDK